MRKGAGDERKKVSKQVSTTKGMDFIATRSISHTSIQELIELETLPILKIETKRFEVATIRCL